MLDQVEHALIGPVDVLPREDQRALRGEALDAGTDRREEDLARSLRVPDLRGVGEAGVDPEQATDHGGLLSDWTRVARSGVEQLADSRRELLPGERGRLAVDDPALGADDLR